MQIYQFSHARSGSTLLYNYLSNILTKHKIIKVHKINFPLNSICFTSIRHPYNTILSRIFINLEKNNYTFDGKIDMKKLNTLISKKLLGKEITNYFKVGGDYLLSEKFNKLKNKVILKYEDFNNNHDYIIEKIKKYFNLKFDDIFFLNIKKNLSKEYIKNKYTNKSKSFKDVDKKTLFHYNHISDFKGDTDYLKILSQDKILLLKKNKKLNLIIKKFKY